MRLIKFLIVLAVSIPAISQSIQNSDSYTVQDDYGVVNLEEGVDADSYDLYVMGDIESARVKLVSTLIRDGNKKMIVKSDNMVPLSILEVKSGEVISVKIDAYQLRDDSGQLVTVNLDEPVLKKVAIK